MIDGDADQRQADCHVDTSVETVQFDRNMALIVIHGDDQVELTVPGARKNGIGRIGAGGIDTLGSRLADGGRDLLDFFAPKEAMLARMRI